MITARVNSIQVQYFAKSVVVHGTCVREAVVDSETVSLNNCTVELKYLRSDYEGMTVKAVRDAVVAELARKAASPEATSGEKKFAGLTLG